MSDRYHVVTGGPGSGKTSLITALAATGSATMPEGGRTIIQDQIAVGGTALPWANRRAFAELMFDRDMRAYRRASALAGPVLFDRAIPDVIGYLRLCGLPVPAVVARAAATRRYARRVFFAPHWPAIFTQDAERKQSEAEAEATGRVMREVYTDCGYELVTLPQGSVAARAAFVRAHIDAQGRD